MLKQIQILFLAEDKDQRAETPAVLNYTTFIELIHREQEKIELLLRTKQLKAFVRKEPEGDQKYAKYVKLSKEEEIGKYLRNPAYPLVTVEFFHSKKQETIRRSIFKIGAVLDKRQKQLRNLANELKDEVNQLNALQIIRKSTSPNEQQVIEVFMVVCDPLVEGDKDSELHPLYHDEIDLPSHIERLRKASLSNGDFMIKAKRVWGTNKELTECLKHGTEGDRERRIFAVVQIFTRVEKHKGVLMVSLEGQGENGVGLRVWEQATIFFKRQMYSNILILIGVGVDQLSELAQQLNFNRPLILISTLSLQDKRIITTTCDRSLIDIENSYNDKYCQVFLQSFYSNLFRRYEIRKCYQLAIKDSNQSSIKQNLWCCCLHVHHETCHWPRVVRRIGQLEAHRLLKHQNYLKMSLDAERKKLQALLIGNNTLDTCTDERICCFWKFSERTSKSFHEALDKFVIWNEREPDEIYSPLDPEMERSNRFQGQIYDKPTGRRRPLTIYKIVRYILKNDICILRSPIISQAKRYFSFARQYIQARNPCLFFYEFDLSSLQQTTSFKRKTELASFKKMAEQLILQRSNTRLGASIKSRRKEWIFFMQYNHDNQRHYQTIFRDFMELSNRHTREVKLKLVLLTDDLQFFAVKIINMLTKSANKNQKSVGNIRIDEPFDIQDAGILERYHNILARHSSDYVKENLANIQDKIQFGENYDQQRQQAELQQMLRREEDVYYFLGFLSQFSEDGFYLNKVSHIILAQLFGAEVIEKALNNKLPVQHINLADSVYLQLHKAYQNHFKNPQNIKRLYFQLRKLQYYYLLMRLYFQYWPQVDQINVVNYPAGIRRFINKEGIFSIDIEKERTEYECVFQTCLKDMGPNIDEIKVMLYDVSNSIHIYHLSQVEKILQEFLKKKKNKHNPTTSKSFIDEAQFKVFQYLLWNIIMKSWLMSLVLNKHYEDNVNKFHVVLIIFFVQAQILLPISEVARIQMHVLMKKSPPKLDDNDFGKLTSLLRFYRSYAFKAMNLDNLEPGWGNHHKCKDLFGNCFYLTSKISDMIDLDKGYEKLSLKARKEYDDFKDYLSMKHKMFAGTNAEKWTHEGLKLIERKVLYYFHFTSEMKKNKSHEQFKQKMQAFERHFKLGEIAYELDKFKAIMPQAMLQEKETILITHYLRVKLEESEVDKAQLDELKGKISSDYLPIFSYLCQKVEQKALFNQTGLIIFARARTLVCDDQPYFYTRRRTLLTEYLGKVFHDRQLKICYFPLTETTLNLFETSQHNYKCQVLCMILTVDAISSEELMFGSEGGVDTVKMPIQRFAERIRRCRIKILILCGKNSIAVCDRLRQILSDSQYNSLVEPSMMHSLSQINQRKIAQSFVKPMAGGRDDNVAGGGNKVAGGGNKAVGGNFIKPAGTVAVSAIHPGSYATNSIKSSDSSSIKQSGSSSSSRPKVHISSSAFRTKPNPFPTVIAIESEYFSLSDVDINSYTSQDTSPQKFQMRQSRPSLYSNPRISVVREKAERLEQEEGPNDIPDQEEGPSDISEQSEDIDQILKDTVDLDIEIADSSGRNKFPFIFDSAQSQSSEGVAEGVPAFKNQVEKYLANEVNQIAMDLITLSIAKNIISKASARETNLTELVIRDIIDKSMELVRHILSSRFEVAGPVFQYINYDIWANNNTIGKVGKGEYEDLTKKFYCAQNNLHDENYYENIGHCLELNQIFKALRFKKVNCIEILGGFKMQKQNLLQQVLWYALTKSLFKFGVLKLDLKDANLNTLIGRTFKTRDSISKQSGILIAMDNIDDNLKRFREDLLKLRGKSFSIIYTTCREQTGAELRQILGLNEFQSVNLNTRRAEEVNNIVYATLLSHIKQKKQFMFSNQMLGAYQAKIDEVMRVVQKCKPEDKLSKGLELLRGTSARRENEKMAIYFNFYRQNFQELVNCLQQIKEITIKIV